MDDYLRFKKLITPRIIQALFWLSALVTLVTGLEILLRGAVVLGLTWIVLGYLSARVFCELLLVIFSIHDHLAEIKALLRDRSGS